MERFDVILSKNLGYIYTVANELKFWDNEELIQVGKISMFESYQKFDPSKGIPFMKFAGNNIRYAMMSYLSENDRLIRIPANKVKEDLKKEIGDREYNNIIISSDKSVFDKSATEEKTIIDFIVEDEINELFSEEEVDLLKTAIKKLKPFYRQVLEMRFGINQANEEEFTLEEVGNKLNGTSRENIRVTEKKAIIQLKKILNPKNIDLTPKIRIKKKKNYSEEGKEKCRESAIKRHAKNKQLN